MKPLLTITNYGHSCFSVTYGDYTMIIDPYRENSIPGLPPLHLTADDVFVTHEHFDHNARSAVKVKEKAVHSPFKVTRISCAHDKEGGRKRGMTDILLFEGENLRFAHFGDIGESLTAEKKELLKDLDLVFLPVGGFYTISPEEAKDMIHELNPHIAIPMHYRTTEFGLPDIEPLENFTSLFDQVIFYREDTLVYDREHTKQQVAVLKQKKIHQQDIHLS